MTPGLSRTCRLALAAAVVFAFSTSVTRAADGPPIQSQLINEELAKAWKTAELKPSKKASDYEFVRRVFIDIVGRIPTAEEVKDFVDADSSKDKRAKLIHRLLYEKEYKPKYIERTNPKDPKSVITYDYAAEYARNFSNIWGVWLMTRGGVAEVYHESMELWLEDHFAKNTRWDEMVRQLITASGKTNDNGATAFVMAHLGEAVPRDKQTEDGRFDAVPITSRVTRLFLGIQTNCIQCHDHPFNPEWKQDNFWGVNAFFRQVERRNGIVVSTRANFLPHLAELEKEGAIPKRAIPVNSPKSRREHLADFIIQHDNFAKAYVNRMWGHFFGRGMNELPAADDFGGHNKVVHPELLNRLAEEFVKYEYDPKKMIEWICNSDAYNLTYQWNQLPDGKGGNAKDEAAPYFTRMALKSMSPEVLFESLETATRLDMAPDKDAKKAKKDAWMARLSRNFGDDEGNEVTFNGTIIQALLMMNGQEINAEISRGDGTSAVEKAMNKHRTATGYSEMGVINELYLMALARKPSSQITVSLPAKDPRTGKDRLDAKGKPIMTGLISEADYLAKQVGDLKRRGPNQQQYKAFFEDVLWSLLNTSEFILNH